MINVILQSLGLYLININMYAKVYQNIPNGLELWTFFTDCLGTNLYKLTIKKTSQSVQARIQILLCWGWGGGGQGGGGGSNWATGQECRLCPYGSKAKPWSGVRGGAFERILDAIVNSIL